MLQEQALVSCNFMLWFLFNWFLVINMFATCIFPSNAYCKLHLYELACFVFATNSYITVFVEKDCLCDEYFHNKAKRAA